jgi:hypothetical protein
LYLLLADWLAPHFQFAINGERSQEPSGGGFFSGLLVFLFLFLAAASPPFNFHRNGESPYLSAGANA